MNYIVRNKSISTGKDNLEQLFVFKNFPIFMGCVNSPKEEDVLADMEWGIDVDSGLIQLTKLIPLDLLYQYQHNDGMGKVWKDHYQAFANFIYEYRPQRILEIGAAHDFIAKNYFEKDPTVKWVVVEPNPQLIKDKRIKIIRGWFDDRFKIFEEIDTVIHSHVLEHTYDPVIFIKHIGSFLKIGQKHIFSFPNMLAMLENKFTNCLNFEHTVFLTEYLVDYILLSNGFRIIKKQYYGNPHSIFYATEKVNNDSKIILENKYQEYKKVFMDFVEYHRNLVIDLNEKMQNINKPTYLFGAHIFSQYLINFGLNTDKIVSILDNSPLKQGKRLYGSDMQVESPMVLSDKGKVNVILKAGIYNEEIRNDILRNINSEVIFW